MVVFLNYQGQTLNIYEGWIWLIRWPLHSYRIRKCVWCKLLRISIAFNPNRRGKTRVWEKWTKKYERRQKPDKTWASHPLQQIGLHHPLHQSQDQISRILIEKFELIYPFIDFIREVLKPIYRLYKTQFSEYNRCCIKFQKKKQLKSK